jgi:hypothetical protein
MKTGRILLALFAVLFIAGIVWLFQLRFQRGDIYPPYSSLRADPLGVKALYESLESCCNFSVSRNYKPFSKRVGETDAVIFFLGLDPQDLDSVPEPLKQQMDQFVLNGGRLVFSFLPTRKDLEKISSFAIGQEEEDYKSVSLSQHWGFQVETKGGLDYLPAHITAPSENLPYMLTAHTRLFFKDVDRSWKILYTVSRNPVLMERKRGKGSILVSTISYFLSNEAMIKERHPGLLLFLLDSKQKIIFDEYHHGIADNPGIAYFVKKYRLGWAVAGLLLLAALYIWKNAIAFIPPDRSQVDVYLTRGKESMAGLRNLLRRNVPPQNLLGICWEEWKKTRPGQKMRVEPQALQRKGASVFERYNEIAESLKEKRNGNPNN